MATRLPSGTYRTQLFVGYDEKGRRRYKSFTGPSAKAADLAALSYSAEHPASASSGLTVCRACNVFLSKREGILSPNTIRGYNSMANMLESKYPKLWRKKLDAVSHDDVQDLVSSLARGGASPKTIKNYYDFLSGVFKANRVELPFALCLKK